MGPRWKVTEPFRTALRPAAGHARPATVWCPLLTPHGSWEMVLERAPRGGLWGFAVESQRQLRAPTREEPAYAQCSAPRKGRAQRTQVSAGADAPLRVVMVK